MTATILTNDVSYLPLDRQAEFLETATWLESLKAWQLRALQHFVNLYNLGLIPADDVAAVTTFARIHEQYRPADPRAARIQ